MEDFLIPSLLKPTIDKLHDDLSSVLTDYENGIITAEDLYAFMVNLQTQICHITYND